LTYTVDSKILVERQWQLAQNVKTNWCDWWLKI